MMKLSENFVQINCSLTLFALVVFFWWSPSQKAHACSCATYSTTQAFEKNDAIFVGKVIDEKTELSESHSKFLERRYEWDPLIRTQKATFLVVKKWKGNIDKTQAAWSGTETSMCDYPVNLGEAYLFYGSKKEGFCCYFLLQSDRKYKKQRGGSGGFG